MNLTDSVNSADPNEALRCAWAALDSIQTEKKGIQVASIAILFYVLCHATGRDVSQALNRAERMVHDADLTRGVSAMRAYMQGELPNG